ncbi:hypothetical protein KUF54_16970 [Comamonas sp. Y33R10-2]|uniref:hypothetical protein n=1 Tax=Comamonas sp. Y33R10-2 TaxID=2853257 RepID=UPI001C5C966D|nr:hypothetical protein [Comamonas sp. Y33R10-2]QXZ09662.1 hypothetical protein KUF54_16970 [Comamonas sp. Y33R10-2]
MIPSSYEGPSNGDYVAYVDELLRTSPEYRRTQRSLAGAMYSAVITPGGQSSSPMAQLRETLQKAKDMAEQQVERKTMITQTVASRTAAAQPVRGSKEEAQQRFKAIEREIESQKSQAATQKKPWISPVSLAMIVGGAIIGQFVQGFGMMLSIMGLMTLVGGVLNRLKGK